LARFNTSEAIMGRSTHMMISCGSDLVYEIGFDVFYEYVRCVPDKRHRLWHFQNQLSRSISSSDKRIKHVRRSSAISFAQKKVRIY
jgi:hypothetical protein